MPRRPNPVRTIALLILVLSAAAPIATGSDADDIKADRARRTKLVQWLAGPRTWAELPEVTAALKDDAVEVRATAMVTAMRLWEAHRNQRMDVVLKWGPADRFLRALARDFDIMPTSFRTASLEIADNLGIEMHEGSVPLLIAAAADTNTPGVHDRAVALVEPFTRNIDRGLMLFALVDYLETHDLATKRAQTAQSVFHLDNPKTRAAAARIAIRDMVFHDFDADGHIAGAIRLLKSWHADESAMARLAMEVSQRPAYDRDNMKFLFYAVTLDSDEAIERAVKLLGSDYPQARRDAAAFLAADPARFDPMRVLRDSTQEGHTLSADLITTLKIDPVKACDQLAAEINDADTTPAACLAAVRTVRQIGLHGDAIRPAVERLLNDSDDNIRYTAAEALDRRDIAVRARIPSLLKDLRSDYPTRRLTAASQLEVLDTEPKEITAALRRAVAHGNMPAREGFIRALERAYATSTNSLDVLRQLAAMPEKGNDPTPAYARAALRELTAAAAQ